MTHVPNGPRGDPIIDLRDDHPPYPPDAFDADGYLTVHPSWVCPPQQVVGWLEALRDGPDVP